MVWLIVGAVIAYFVIGEMTRKGRLEHVETLRQKKMAGGVLTSAEKTLLTGSTIAEVAPVIAYQQAMKRLEVGKNSGSTGNVKWWNPEKGFGYITSSEGVDMFFHHSSLPQPLVHPEDGKKVKFQVEQGSKGPMAIAIEFI